MLCAIPENLLINLFIFLALFLVLFHILNKENQCFNSNILINTDFFQLKSKFETTIFCLCFSQFDEYTFRVMSSTKDLLHFKCGAFEKASNENRV